ncbi:MAG: nitronate monooxygenase, partial [Hyphomicrobiaceae bacterium]
MAKYSTRAATALSIDAPLICAPMGRWAEATLAAAVSEAGGLGTFGAWPHMGLSTSEVRQMVSRIREQTSRPFGAGFIGHRLDEHSDHLNVALEEAVPVILLSFGDASSWIPRIHDGGAKVVCQVQTFELAKRAVDAGTDVLCLQGNAAGGHTGTQNLLPFLIQAVEAFPDTPIVASGGISCGRSLASILAAGAEGAWIGTAFVACKEAAFTSQEFRQSIIESDGRDTVYSAAVDLVRNHGTGRPPWPDGIALRHRRNEIT